MLKLPVPRSVLSFFIIVLFGVITIGIITYEYQNVLEEKSGILRHSKETIVYASSLLNICYNIQIQSNLFVTTKDSSYLKLYSAACKDAFVKIDSLKNYFLNDRPKTNSQLDLIKSSVNQLILLSDNSIKLKERNLFNQPDLLNKIIRGNNYLSLINNKVALINNDEAETLLLREKENNKAESAYGDSLLVLLISILILVVALFAIIYFNFRKRLIVEERLKKSESRFFTIANSSPLAIAILENESMVFTFVNIAFEKLFLLKRMDVMGKNVVELNLISESNYRKFIDQFIRGSHQLRNVEYRLNSKDGIFRDLLFSTDVLTIADKNYIALTVTDISERKRNEELVAKASEMFSKLFHESPAGGIISRKSDGAIIDCNNAYCEMVGYRCEEIIGKSSLDLKILTPEQYEIKKRIVSEIGSIHNYEMKIRTRNGSLRWVSLSLQSVLINNEDAIISVLIDITEHKAAEEKTKLALAKEKELNDMKSNFVSMASHEFRTPLATILSSTQLIEKYTTTEQQEKRDKHIRRIESSVKNLIGILDEFLSLGKIEEGRVAPKIEKFNLNEFTSKLCNEMQMMLKTGQEVVYNHEGCEEVNLDPVFVRHILTNLTSNAIKYSPENSKIYITTSINEKVIYFSVKDNGIGISEEDQRNLFQRFYRASNVGGIQGTGLGLHILKRYVDMLNGKIKFTSELGRGTEFIIEFSNSNT